MPPRHLAPFEPEFIEQPVSSLKLETLVQVREAVGVPLAADQDNFTSGGVYQTCVRQAADVIVLALRTLAPPAVTAKKSQCELAVAEQCADHSYQCLNSGSMADDGVALQPVSQQSHPVHAVLSDLNGCFATKIRSHDSMHVDHLTNCNSVISHQYLWGYVSVSAYWRRTADSGPSRSPNCMDASRIARTDVGVTGQADCSFVSGLFGQTLPFAGPDGIR